MILDLYFWLNSIQAKQTKFFLAYDRFVFEINTHPAIA